MHKNAEIQFRLKEVAAQHDVRVIFAAASGHHADGIALPNERIDIRFAYLRPTREYLRVQEREETIAPVETDGIQLTGWDVRKWLREIAQASPHVFAWANSPKVYVSEFELDKRLPALTDQHLAMRPLMHHLTEHSAKLYHVYLGPNAGQVELTVQRYLEMAHTILSARWLHERESYPPRDFDNLLTQLEGHPQLADLQEIQKQLTENHNNHSIDPPEALSEFLFKTLQTCLYSAGNLKGAQEQYSDVNALFYELTQAF